MPDCVAGIDLGGTLTKFGIIDRKGELLGKDQIPTDSKTDHSIFFKKLYHKINELQQSLGSDLVLKGIGLAAPTGNSSLGTIEQAYNLEWPAGLPAKNILESYADIPVTILNDANAAAMGEMVFGAAQDIENFICITIGTGLGCGIVANGELITGCNGHAGEIGHNTVFPEGRICNCGKQGCFETYVSAPGMVYTARKLMKERTITSKLRDIPADCLEAKKIAEAALQKDALAMEICTITGEVLGFKLADIVGLTDPEVIIIAGGLARAGALILDPAKKSMEMHLLSIYKNKVDILPSSLIEKNAAILGLGAFMWNNLKQNQTAYE